MSARITRKRSRVEEDEELPPAKQEPDQNDPGHPDASVGSTPGVDGPARDGQVLKKDEQFWFEDGTVILIARDIEFRVYKGVLSEHSSVFKTLFADRRHGTRNVHIDEEQTISCPVMHLTDSPEALRHLLRACFSKRLGRLYDERKPSYQEISAAIRLGKKYQIDELYSQSMEYLRRYFPSTLDSWTALDLYGPPGWDATENIGAVNLCRFTGELSILPSAFIACICAQMTEGGRGIGHGITLDDGSQEYLSPDDLTICFDGKSSLRTASVTAALRTFKPTVSPQCMTSTACKKALRNVLLNFEHNVDILLNGNPFPGYTSFVKSADLHLCPSCTTMVEQRSLREREDVWKRLPGLLGIEVPGWGEQPPQQADAK